MTTPTVKDLTADPKQAQKEAGAKFWEAVIWTIAVTALIVLFAGIALSRGFGVHVPFVDSWVLLLTGLAVVRLLTLSVAGGWFGVRAREAVRISFAAQLGREAAQAAVLAQAGGDFEKLLASLKPEDGAK